MPGKHVRFSNINQVRILPALSPSSPSVFPCAPLIPSPTPNNLPVAPSFPPQFPRPIIRSTRIHPLFQSSRTPILNFDLRQSPSTITSNQERLTRRTFYEPATEPPLQSIIIAIPDLPWTVTVDASREYVTVHDVLDELYYSLRTNISARDFHALPNDQVRRKVTMAYEQRYRRITGPREYEDEKRRGITRVDFLMGRTKFMGLSPTSFGPGHFVLHSA